jgi:mannose-1-phosphate guanylyltransferase/mannose-6-phosphate isomerase
VGKDSPPVHVVILAGGAGERFWPASRSEHPKHFLEVVGEQTLLEGTLARARRCTRADRIWIVCGEQLGRKTRRFSGLPASRVLLEPRRRNTAMAVAWAAHRIRAVDPDAVMVVLPADHHVPNVGAFARDISLAARAAAGSDVLVTLGVRPTRAEPGYGYIQNGKPISGHRRLREVRRFVEKPDAATARRWVKRSDYRWNAGIFIFKAGVLLEEVARHAPDLHRALAPFRPPRSRGARRPRPSSKQAAQNAYRRAPSLPIDVAVLERSDRVWTLPVEFKWSDVGTWASLAEELGVGRPGKRAGNRAPGGLDGSRKGSVLLHRASNNLVWPGDRLIALLDVEDLVVVDTGDVIFVTKLDPGSDVRGLVAKLRETGREDLM